MGDVNITPNLDWVNLEANVKLDPWPPGQQVVCAASSIFDETNWHLSSHI